MEDEQYLSMVLKLRNDDFFLYDYVFHFANEIWEGNIDDYDIDDIEDFNEAIDESIGLVLFSMLDTDELSSEEFHKEFLKTSRRLKKVSKIKNKEM